MRIALALGLLGNLEKHEIAVKGLGARSGSCKSARHT